MAVYLLLSKKCIALDFQCFIDTVYIQITYVYRQSAFAFPKVEYHYH